MVSISRCLLLMFMVARSTTIEANTYTYDCAPSFYTTLEPLGRAFDTIINPPNNCSSVKNIITIFNAYLAADLPPGYTGHVCFNSVLQSTSILSVLTLGSNYFTSTMCYDFVAGALDTPVSERNPSEIAHYDASKFGKGSRIGVMTYDCTSDDNICTYWGSYVWSMTVDQSGANMPLPDFSWTWEASTYQVDVVDLNSMLLYKASPAPACGGYPVSQTDCLIHPQISTLKTCDGLVQAGTCTSSSSQLLLSDPPTVRPSTTPSVAPSRAPSAVPSVLPSTATPSTLSPTRAPSKTPSSDPSYAPSSDPSYAPSIVPSTAAPSSFPSSWLYVNVTTDDYTVAPPRCLTDKKLDCPTLTIRGRHSFQLYYDTQNDVIEALKNAITFFSRLHQTSVIIAMNKTQLTGESSSLVLKYDLIVPYGDPQVAYNYSSAYEAYVTINSTVTDAVSSGNFSLFMNTFPGIHVMTASADFEPLPGTKSPSQSTVDPFSLSPTGFFLWVVVALAIITLVVAYKGYYIMKRQNQVARPKLKALREFSSANRKGEINPSSEDRIESNSLPWESGKPPRPLIRGQNRYDDTVVSRSITSDTASNRIRRNESIYSDSSELSLRLDPSVLPPAQSSRFFGF